MEKLIVWKYHVLIEQPFFVTTALQCQSGKLRLVSQGARNEGRVEICFNEMWGTICGDSWGQQDATVACRQLGYSEHGIFKTAIDTLL